MGDAGPFNTVGEMIADMVAEWRLEAPYRVGAVETTDLADAVRVAACKAMQDGKARFLAGEPGRKDLVVEMRLRFTKSGRWYYDGHTLWREDLAA